MGCLQQQKLLSSYVCWHWNSGRLLLSRESHTHSTDFGSAGVGWAAERPGSGAVLTLHVSSVNSCTEIEFIYHTIHPLKGYNSVVFSILTALSLCYFKDNKIIKCT